jgi:hypothetical protein
MIQSDLSSAVVERRGLARKVGRALKFGVRGPAHPPYRSLMERRPATSLRGREHDKLNT